MLRFAITTLFVWLVFVLPDMLPTIQAAEKGEEVKLNDTWSYLSTGNRDHDKYLENLFTFLHKEFESIFGADVVNGIKCTIYNDAESASPFIHYVSDHELKIRLRTSSMSYWCQVVFQLAHEMTHYLYCQTYDYTKLYGSKWNEEIVCEAMSLYMMMQLAHQWGTCELSEYDRHRIFPYSCSIYSYVADERNKGFEKALKSSQGAVPIQEFAGLNKTAGGDRENHRAETRHLYDLLITLEKEQIKPIILEMYRYYLVEDCYIDYERWIKNTAYPDVIEKLSQIQPKIVVP